jgi:hypothetical protein
MSNLDDIKEHVRQNRLFEIVRRDLRATNDREYRRWIYVSLAISQEIANRFAERAFRLLSAQFQNFIIGRTVPVALEPDHKKAEWARLKPGNHEVWETRVRNVSPELRVFGRFADIDTFVALNLYEGWEVKGRPKWDEAKARCQSDWSALFPDPPVQGRVIRDYIRTNFTLI